MGDSKEDEAAAAPAVIEVENDVVDDLQIYTQLFILWMVLLKERMVTPSQLVSFHYQKKEKEKEGQC